MTIKCTIFGVFPLTAKVMVNINTVLEEVNCV